MNATVEQRGGAEIVPDRCDDAGDRAVSSEGLLPKSWMVWVGLSETLIGATALVLMLYRPAVGAGVALAMLAGTWCLEILGGRSMVNRG